MLQNAHTQLTTCQISNKNKKKTSDFMVAILFLFFFLSWFFFFNSLQIKNWNMLCVPIHVCVCLWVLEFSLGRQSYARTCLKNWYLMNRFEKSNVTTEKKMIIWRMMIKEGIWAVDLIFFYYYYLFVLFFRNLFGQFGKIVRINCFKAKSNKESQVFIAYESENVKKKKFDLLSFSFYYFFFEIPKTSRCSQLIFFFCLLFYLYYCGQCFFLSMWFKKNAMKAISEFHAKTIDGHHIRCHQYTNRYCEHWLSKKRCSNPRCTFLHALANAKDCFIKTAVNIMYFAIVQMYQKKILYLFINICF